MTEDKDVARTWLEGLAARGVTVTIRNNRLWLHPASAYHALSDDEVLVLRHRRAAIKDVMKAGISLDVCGVDPTVKVVEPTPRPAPEICCYCMHAPCVGREHPAFETLHALDEAEQWRRRAEQRDKDAREFELRRIYRLPPPTWD